MEMMVMEDLPLMQPCSNATTKAHVSSAYGTKTEVCATSSEVSSYVSWAGGGGSEDGETIDSISLYSARYERSRREKGAIANIVDAIAQIFDVFVISPDDIDCVADVIDEATQELAAQLTEENAENALGSGGFEVQVL